MELSSLANPQRTIQIGGVLPNLLMCLTVRLTGMIGWHGSPRETTDRL